MSGNGLSIALLRGINVGGRNRLPMRDLASIFEAAGCADVRTYIQSGNVVYRAGPSSTRALPATVSALIAERFGMDIPIVVRTAQELTDVVEANPFLSSTPDTRSLHVGFLLEQPGPEAIEALDPNRSPPDEFVVSDRQMYLRLPNGAGRSKLTAQYFDSRLRTVMTVRNWRTVLTLLDMVRDD